MQRRDALKTMGAAVAGSALMANNTNAEVENNEDAPKQQPKKKPTTIAMLLYPYFTALDLVGPHQVLSSLSGYKVELVWKDKKPVVSDSGLTILPTMTFEDCPEDVAVLFVPGGTFSTLKMMEDEESIAFLKSRGAKAEYVTSVCTGSLVLGAAGLLEGCKATSHWLSRDVLKVLGATPVDKRVVIDRNRITGGGVTAGIDFGFTIASEMKGEDYAKRVQLIMEYTPDPPFKCGCPKEAGKEITEQTRKAFAPFVNATVAAAEKASAKLKKDAKKDATEKTTKEETPQK